MAKKVIFADWDNAPHLTAEMKAKYIAEMHPSLRDARTRGIPFLGAGQIYPVPIDTIMVKPFVIPDDWPRAFGLDVGWSRTAALWGALDKESDILYCYSEHYVGGEAPQVHASAILGDGAGGNLRAKWIKGVIDPAAKGRSQSDGLKLMSQYRDQGLDINTAHNGVTSGIDGVWLRLSSGRLKVFSSLQFFFKEYMLYRRDKEGKIVKKNDHLMDALRYLVMSGTQRAQMVPVKETTVIGGYNDFAGVPNSWMGS